jgi:hypothetical protein
MQHVGEEKGADIVLVWKPEGKKAYERTKRR